MELPGRRVAAAASLFGLLALPTHIATPAPAGLDLTARAVAARIDPTYLVQAAAGAAPGVLTWDDDEVTRSEVNEYLDANGIRFESLAPLDMAFVCARSGDDVRRIAAAPGAISVYGDSLMTPALDTSVSTAFNGDPNAVWSSDGITGDGVGIAVIDTGIDATHPDLQMGTRTKLNRQILFSSHDWQGGSGDPCPPLIVERDVEDSETISGHGTHLASVAAGDGTASNGKYKGMAPEADLYGFNVVEPASLQRWYLESGQISMLRVIAALRTVLVIATSSDGPSEPIKVILMGWTSPGLHDPWNPISMELHELTINNVVTVMPVGNEGPARSDCDAAETCHFNRFALGEWVIGVGATPARSRTRLEDYSSRGDPTVYEHYEYPISYRPVLVAPGSDVTAARRVGLSGLTDPPSDHALGANGAKGRNLSTEDYQTLTGTSVAAAHVAGAIALMQQVALEAKGCYLTSEQVREVLEQTATSMPAYEPWDVGAGALDATAAVWGARFAPKISSRNWFDCPPPA